MMFRISAWMSYHKLVIWFRSSSMAQIRLPQMLQVSVFDYLKNIGLCDAQLRFLHTVSLPFLSPVYCLRLLRTDKRESSLSCIFEHKWNFIKVSTFFSNIWNTRDKSVGQTVCSAPDHPTLQKFMNEISIKFQFFFSYVRGKVWKLLFSSLRAENERNAVSWNFHFFKTMLGPVCWEIVVHSAVQQIDRLIWPELNELHTDQSSYEIILKS